MLRVDSIVNHNRTSSPSYSQDQEFRFRPLRIGSLKLYAMTSTRTDCYYRSQNLKQALSTVIDNL